MNTGRANPPPRLLLIGFALAIVYIVWGSTYLGIGIMVEDMPPLVAAGTRFLLAGVLLGAFLGFRGGCIACGSTASSCSPARSSACCCPSSGRAW